MAFVPPATFQVPGEHLWSAAATLDGAHRALPSPHNAGLDSTASDLASGVSEIQEAEKHGT